MADPTASPSCPACGKPLLQGVAQGLCPYCLLAGAAQPTKPTAPRPGTAPLEQVAAAFPQLQVLEMIGQGGMGAVFKVRQPKLDRFAALKLLPHSLAADAAFASRFEREARMLAKLSHPNIVSVYDYGQAGEFFYLLMEYVDGVNLRQAMRASRFEPRQALAIVPIICEALQYAHDEGVLHRDIKPENILLDSKGRVKLVDFGIAKLTAEPDSDHADALATDPRLTQAGAALGTPSYMAPEQREHPSDVDHRADIYSLGVVFYELLTGELPSGGLVRPSEKSGADPRVDAIVRQALEKERERRQHSAGEMRTQVQTISGSPGEPNSPRPSAGGSPLWTPRFSRLAIVGGSWSPLFFIVFVLAFTVRVQVGPYTGPTPWDWLLRLTVLPLGLAAPLGTTILGWIAVTQIRRSAGRLYGLGLAVFDGLVFPLLALDGTIYWAWKLIFQTLFPEFFNGGDIIDRTTGRTTSLQSIALLLALATSAFVDFVIAWCTWRALTRPGKQPITTISATPDDSPALAIIASGFWGMAGVLALLAWIRMPNPQQSVVWGILAAAVLAVLFAIPVRKTRLGKRALIGGSMNVAVWLIIFIIFAVMNSVHSVAAQANAPSTVDFHYHVFEADSALVDRLIPKTQRSADPLGADSAFKNNTAQATGGRGKGDFMVSTKGTTYTDAQVAIITPGTLQELLKAVNRAPGLLADRNCGVPSASEWWPTGVSDGWSYSRSSDKFLGGGSGSQFLAYRQVAGQDQIHIDCSVNHGIDTPGNASQLNALLYYEGTVPREGDIAFLIPFFRKDDSTHYLVAVYQIAVAAASDEADTTTEPSAATTAIAPAVGATDEPHIGLTALGQVAPPTTAPTTAPQANGKSVVVFFAIPGDYALEVIEKLDAKQSLPVVVFNRSLDDSKQLGRGSLVGVDNQMDPQTGTLRCKAQVTPIDDALLYPNQLVYVSLDLGVSHHVAPVSNPAGATTEPAMAATAAETDTGPVIERVIDAENPDHRGLNLATGEFGKSTAAQPLSFSDDGSNSLRDAGVDVFYPDEPTEGHYLMALDMRLCVGSSPPAQTVDGITGDEIRQLLAHMKEWRAGMFSPGGGLNLPNPASHIVGNSLYVFTTRDGVDGALQIVNHRDSPRSITIRYKLVRPAAFTAPTP